MRLEINTERLEIAELEILVKLMKEGKAKRIEEEKKDKKTELLKELEGETKQKEDKGTFHKRKPNKQKMTREEFREKACKLIRASNKKWTIPELYKEITGRTSSGMFVYDFVRPAMEGDLFGIRKEVGGTEKRRFIKFIPAHMTKKTIKTTPEASAYKREMGYRATELAKKIAKENSIPYEQALGRAWFELRNVREEVKAQFARKKSDSLENEILEKFPQIEGVDKEYNIIAAVMVKNAIKFGRKITPSEFTYPLGINEARWNDFVTDFMAKSNMICRLFGVENHFKTEKEGRYSNIKYEK